MTAVLIKRGNLGAPEWLRWFSIQLLISAQVMVSQFMSLSPVSGSMLTGQSLLGILSPYFTVLLLLLSLSQNKEINLKTEEGHLSGSVG